MSAAIEPTWPTVRVTVSVNELDWASGELWDLGTTGIAEHPLPNGEMTLVCGFPSEEEAVSALSCLPTSWRPMLDVVHGAEWLDAWREHFPVTRIGRFLLVPAWKDTAGSRPEGVGRPGEHRSEAVERSPDVTAGSRPEGVGRPGEHRSEAVERSPDVTAGDALLRDLGPDDIVMALDPGRAFGTGAHPSTALILELLPDLITPGMSVLDVGCGSGVLSVAAALLGASSVVGVDIEDEAVRVTQANAALSNVSSVVVAATTPVAKVPGTYPLVLANILAPVLLALAPHLTARVAPGGHLVLAGFIDTQVDQVTSVYEALGLTLDSTAEHGIWRSMVLTH